MKAHSTQYDVAIVGLGPTGAVLANILGMQGWRVVGLEREEDIYYAPRAVHFDDEIMRVFQSVGLSDEIAGTSEVFTEMEFLLEPRGRPRLRLNVGTQDGRHGYPGAWWFHQPTLERHFWDGMRRFPNVTIVAGVEASEIEQDDTGVTVRATNQAGKPFEARARYLIGCDGGRSFVRRTAGLLLDSAKFDEAWVVVDTKARCGGKDPTLPKVHQQVCDPRQPVTYVPMAGAYYEWQFMVTGGKSEREATDPAFVRSQLRSFVDLDRIDITRITYYKFHALWARKWRNGRIVLAGDAAHQMPPFLGQGMCSGIRDAQSLGWRLHMVLSGSASEFVFDDYEAERSEHVGHIIKGAMFLGRVIQTRSRLVAFLRNTLMFWPSSCSDALRMLTYRTANRKRPITRGLIGRHRRAVSGTLFPQPPVRHGGVERPLDDALPMGFVVLARHGALAQHASILRALDLRLATLVEFGRGSGGSTLDDSEGRLSSFFDGQGVDFIILRPDRYVFDAGRATDFPAVAGDFAAQMARRGAANPSTQSRIVA